MISFPGCKINLGLQIIAKRSDGYHDIVSLKYPVKINDILEIVPATNGNALTFTSSGLTIPGEAEDNLCLKAYNLLKNTYKLPPVQIHLHKCIPMGGGLGGGSSNGAETIKLLDQLFELNIPLTVQKEYAAQLGSDCPFFIENTPQFATGTGTTLAPFPLDLSGYYLVVLNEGIHISTKEAYSDILMNTDPQDLKSILEGGIYEWRNNLCNDFERHIFKLHPELAVIKNDLYQKGALYASMTGSGSTMYGIFENSPKISAPENGFLKIIQL